MRWLHILKNKWKNKNNEEDQTKNKTTIKNQKPSHLPFVRVKNS
jgi:hypothetical protein